MLRLAIIILSLAFAAGCASSAATAPQGESASAAQLPDESKPVSEEEESAESAVLVGDLADGDAELIVSNSPITSTDMDSQPQEESATKHANNNAPGQSVPADSAASSAPAPGGSMEQADQVAPAATPAPTPASQAKPSAVPTAPVPEVTVENPPQTEPVRISVIGDADKGVILEETAVEWKDSDAVIDILKRVTRANKIQMESRGSGKAAYVEGIANLYEFDKGAKSGWVFRVNGVVSDIGAGAYTIQGGDLIEWLYTLDMGKDITNEAGGE